MYKNSELDDVAATFANHIAAKRRLEEFLAPVAGRLGYQEVVDAGLHDTTVWFTSRWDGPYQSVDMMTFQFPAAMLPQGQEAIIDYLEEKRQAEANRAKEAQDAEKEHLDRKKYEELRAKFG